jgi:putative membrane protein
LPVIFFLAISRIGIRRTLLYSTVAYLVAFACEWSSAVAGTGIPFGVYRYIESTKDKELWVCGVPFMDSLSFTFLSYVSWEMAILLLGPMFRKESGGGASSRAGRNSMLTSVIASLLMMFLDIVIDPVALQGDRWFLGKIYEYPKGGAYFGVTLMNFLGWFVVCFIILRLYIILERLVGERVPGNGAAMRSQLPYRELGPVVLYFGVIGFNLFMTFWIGETMMGFVGSFLTLSLALLVIIVLSKTGGWRSREIDSGEGG